MRISRLLFTTMLLTLLGGYSLAVQAADGAIKVPKSAAAGAPEEHEEAIWHDGAIKVTSIAEVEVVAAGKDGSKTVMRASPEKAVPGTEVIFTNTFENVSKKAASNIVINNPIPNDTTYKAGSAFGRDTVIVFSADGGKTFDTADKLKTKGADGRQRNALPGEYTHIRWTYKGQLTPGKTGEVGFRAVIK